MLTIVYKPSGAMMVGDYTGVLVIGHGTQDASGTAAYFEIFEEVRQLLPESPVEGAFLEFSRPTIAEGIARLVAQGATQIAAVPLFLSAAGHTTKDVPRTVTQAAGQYSEGSGFRVQGSDFRKRHEKLEISLMPHVGAHQRVVELSALRFRESLTGCLEIPSNKILLVLAAHGSPEPEAITELSEFAARREKLTPVARVEPCFAVLGAPQLADLPARLAIADYRRIVVQAHLLLRGRYYEIICQQIENFRREFPDIDWIVTEPLGPDRLLAQAVAEIVKDEG